CFMLPLQGRSSTFTFSLSNLSGATDGSTECLRINNGKIFSLGTASTRITVNAKEDSFSMAKERMVQLEDGTKKQQTKELNMCKRQSSKAKNRLQHKLDSEKSKGNRAEDIKPRFPSSTNAVDSPLSSSTGQIQTTSPGGPVGCGPSPPIPNQAVFGRSLRERVIHILALRPYGRAELLLRLQRDGLSQVQKDQLDGLLTKVGRVCRGSAYALSPSVVGELDPQWPGYTATERSRILSLKESKRVPSPSYTDSPPANRSHTPSPVNPTSSCSGEPEDQFARRPTRASAPLAPHPLSRKIAALNLLSSGVEEREVASRIGVSPELLHQWRASEQELRERHRRLNSHRTPSESHTSPVAESQQPNPVASTRTAVPSTISPVADIRISPPKRARADNLSNPLPHSNDPEFNNTVKASKSQNIHAAGSKVRAAANVSTPSQATTVDATILTSVRQGHSDISTRFNPTGDQSRSLSPSSSLHHDSLHPSLYLHSRPSQFCPLGVGGGTGGGGGGGGGGIGSEGESAPHTPCSNVSSGGSTDGTTAAANPFSSGPGRLDTNGCFIDRTGRARPILPLSVTCDLDMVTDHPVEPLHETYPLSGKLLHCGHCSSVDVRFTFCVGLYPTISKTEQVELYRAEFQSTYPTYLRMYNSFPDIWRGISNLHNRVLDAAGTDGWDSPTVARLAEELDSLLGRTRTAKYQDDLAQLTLISYKLRLLKRRLAEARMSQMLPQETTTTDIENVESSKVQSHRTGKEDTGVTHLNSVMLDKTRVGRKRPSNPHSSKMGSEHLGGAGDGVRVY
ncbi:RNA polymerase II elongation factor ELL, partial [Clonorchis sinensis]